MIHEEHRKSTLRVYGRCSVEEQKDEGEERRGCRFDSYADKDKIEICCRSAREGFRRGEPFGGGGAGRYV